MTNSVDLNSLIFSSPGWSPGRAIVLPPGIGVGVSVGIGGGVSKMLKFFMCWARHCQASYPVPVTGLVLSALVAQIDLSYL